MCGVGSKDKVAEVDAHAVYPFIVNSFYDLKYELTHFFAFTKIEFWGIHHSQGLSSDPFQQQTIDDSIIQQFSVREFDSEWPKAFRHISTLNSFKSSKSALFDSEEAVGETFSCLNRIYCVVPVFLFV